MQIGELAHRHGMSTAMIRHYERLDLFDPDHVVRAPNGYREFTEGASARIRLIRIGQQAGFSLRQMRTELAHWADGTMAPEERAALLRRQLATIEAKLRELRASRRLIRARLTELDGAERAAR